MKKGIFTLFALMAFTFATQAQVLVNEQTSLIVKRTATWCPFCGQYGWTFMDYMVEDNDDNAIILGAHFGTSDLTTQAAEDILSNIGGSGQPRFYMGETDQGVSSGNIDSKRAEVQSAVDAAFANTPIAKMGIDALVTEEGASTGIVSVLVDFNEEVDVAYNLSVLVIEDNVMASQAGQSGLVAHHKILQESLGATFGFEIPVSTINSGAVVQHSFDFDVSAYNLDEVEFAAILWKQVGDKFEFANGIKTSEFKVEEDPNNTAIITAEQAAMNIAPSISTNTSIIQVELVDNQTFSLNVFNINGQLIKTLANDQNGIGTEAFELNKADFGAGVYFVNLQIADKVLTKKVIFVD